MTALDAADLVVIAGRTLGIDAGAALAQMDVTVAQQALTEARPAGTDLAEPGAAAAAAVGLMHALLRHRPFPRQGQQVAVAAGLQFLSLNGWQADLNPPATAAVVVEALASGQLAPADAAAWLSPRLTPARLTPARLTPTRLTPTRLTPTRLTPTRLTPARLTPARLSPARLSPALPSTGQLTQPWTAGQAQAGARQAPARARRAPAGRASRGRPPAIPGARVRGSRAVAGAVLAVAVGGAALLAAACSRAPNVPAAPTSVVHTMGTSTPKAPPASVPRATHSP